MKERKLTADGIELTFATNYLAYFLLTHELLPLLESSAPARVVNLASKYGRTKIDFEDLQKLRTRYSYLKSTPQTMLARVLFTQELAHRLDGSGVVVNAVHPGLVAHTGLLQDTRGPFKWFTDTFGSTPEKGADTVLWLATAPEAATISGKLFTKRKEIRTPGQGSDPAARKRLWEESEKLTVGSGPSIVVGDVNLGGFEHVRRHGSVDFSVLRIDRELRDEMERPAKAVPVAERETGNGPSGGQSRGS